MGFIRKITGVQSQIDATNANASAQENATKAAAAAQTQTLMQNAEATAAQQGQLAARSAAEAKAATAVSQPLGTADVQLQPDSPDSAAAVRNKRRASFGKNYSTGVSI